MSTIEYLYSIEIMLPLLYLVNLNVKVQTFETGKEITPSLIYKSFI
jgi:hypothetical protein